MDVKLEIERNDHGAHFVYRESNSSRDVSHGTAFFATSHLDGAEMESVCIGGIGTEAEYRRSGFVREMFRNIFEIAAEEGCAVSMLHPFSFAYYRKFGYERVADHRIIEFPMSALNCFERCGDLVRYQRPEQLDDLTAIYNEFAARRNIMFRRTGSDHFPLNGQPFFIWYDGEGRPASYIKLSVENYLCINRMASINLNVYEMCFTTRESLTALFGFMRMYEGQLESVKIHNCAMAPEVELMLRNYTHTKITVLPDIMARVHDVGTVLGAVNYPECHGHFTVALHEEAATSHDPALTDGIWQVEYQKGTADVKRLPDGSDCDFECTVGAFTQLIYGYNSFGYETARFTHGADFNTPASDFFTAFPNRPGGLFEHF